MIVVQGDSGAEDAIVAEASFVAGVFTGQLSSSVQCQACDHKAASLEPFMDLSLPIPINLSQEVPKCALKISFLRFGDLFLCWYDGSINMMILVVSYLSWRSIIRRHSS